MNEIINLACAGVLSFAAEDPVSSQDREVVKRKKSLSNEICNVETFLQVNPCDVLCISEHWAAINRPVDIMSIEGYTESTHYSRDIHIHGGVAVYIEYDICFSELEEIRDVSQQLCCECCAVKKTLQNSITLIIASVYRYPGCSVYDFLKRFEIILNRLHNKFRKCNTVICDDFDINIPENNLDVKKFVHLLFSFGFNTAIKTPTRYIC
nr:unnamed protein product [Callosobruchus analis]CAI5826784.1 unnamed protein product [Callosobruchus analis]